VYLASLDLRVAPISLRLFRQSGPPAVAAGAALFQRSCASCHNVEAAPSLATASSRTVERMGQISADDPYRRPRYADAAVPALSDEALRQPRRLYPQTFVVPPRDGAAGNARGLPPARQGVVSRHRFVVERIAARASEPQNWLTTGATTPAPHYSASDADHQRQRRSAARRVGAGSAWQPRCSRRTPLVVGR